MLRINQLRLPITHTQEDMMRKVKKILRENHPVKITIVRRSIDARKKPELFFNYILNVAVDNEQNVYQKCDKKQVELIHETDYQFPIVNDKETTRPIIIGMGPAGIFCGYMLAQAGFKPIILERGNPIEERTADVEKFWKTGELNTESNVQFGEGGAGTFSDGKLNTLVKDTYGRNKKVLSIFVESGAPEEIKYDYKPHIGTDVLRRVIINMRNQMIQWGGEIRFQSKVTSLVSENNHITGVIVNEQEKIPSEYVILAPGHSARDTFSVLYETGIKMEAKPFAIGMRVEHPQQLINRSQYGTLENKILGILGNAPYKLTAKSKDQRGVYSFCMCPGGYVVNASSEPNRLAVNGMSYSGRNGQNANSAIIVTVTPKDYDGEHPLSGIEFQRRLEEKAFEIGEGQIPVEKYGIFKKAVEPDLVPKQTESRIPENFTPCIKGQWQYAPVHEILPVNLQKAFIEGMEQFGRMIHGFNDANVLIEGLESRTSSPIRILRDETLQSSLKGLYPCGEGAGYAGGITSAAMDGIKVAEEVAKAMMNTKL